MRTLSTALIGAVLLAGSLGAVPSANAATASHNASSSAQAATSKNSDTKSASSQESATSKESNAASASSQEDAALEAIPAENIITAEDLYTLVEEGAVSSDTQPSSAKSSSQQKASEAEDDSIAIIDIRSLAIFSEMHIPGATCVPAGKVFSIRMREVPRDQTVVLIDADGSRVAEAWQMLVDKDYDPSKILVVSDGMDAWFAADYPALATPIRLGC